jgi:pimeloyl-ACP methyl ester carboxylesterase
VPSLRGFGETRFKNEHAFRSGEMTAIAEDTIELADALDLDRFALVGHDWGARAAYIVASQHGQRLTHCIALSVGYAALDANQEIGLNQIEHYWYQWYMALPQGERLVREKRTELAEHAWRTWSSSWQFPEVEFRLTAQSFNNPDWAEITVHSYRQRWASPKATLIMPASRRSGIPHRLSPCRRLSFMVPTTGQRCRKVRKGSRGCSLGAISGSR